MFIDSKFPSGNIVVERIDGDDAYLKQDLRDTAGDWFYWCFRIRNAGGRRIRFHMPGNNLLTDRGAAASLDEGRTWKWLPKELVGDSIFEYEFKHAENDARFSMGMPYSGRELDRFLEKFRGNPDVQLGSLCKSAKGRSVEKIGIGGSGSKFLVLITARHHCCEMMANYAMEGIIEALAGEKGLSEWFLDNVQALFIPFMDRDGVEEGDQGKNRKPHDHNRDYIPDAIYNETRALMDFVPAWTSGRRFFSMDIHCPWIKGKGNNIIYIPGSGDERNWKEQTRFGNILMEVNKGPLPYSIDDNLPFGKGWNTGTPAGLKTNSNWMLEQGATVSMTLEIPYSEARGQEVNQDTARTFGHYLAAAIREYLISSGF